MLVCQQCGVIQGFEPQTRLPPEDAFQLCFGVACRKVCSGILGLLGQLLSVSEHSVSHAGCSHRCVWLVQNGTWWVRHRTGICAGFKCGC